MFAWIMIGLLASYIILGVVSMVISWKEAGRKVEIEREHNVCIYHLYKEIRRLNDRIDRTAFEEDSTETGKPAESAEEFVDNFLAYCEKRKADEKEE